MSLVLMSTLAGHPATSEPRPKEVALMGQIRSAAGGPAGKARVLLVTKDAEEFELHTAVPANRTEIERLAGVKVKIFGLQDDPRLPRGRHVLVDRFEIVDVGNGVVPELGVIASLQMGGKTRLLFVNDQGQAALLPAGWAKKMSRHVGAKIWMVGKRSGGKLKPARFAILRSGGGQ